MKKIVLLFSILALASIVSFGQNYSPLKKGSKKEFKMKNGSYTRQVLKKTATINGVEYYQSLTKYSWGSEINIKLRVDSLGNELYLDPKSNKESINFPVNPKVGFSWLSTDGAWKYQILSLNTEFVTPEKKYNDCLVIKAEQLTGRDKDKLDLYYNYYVNDIGYVGSENKNGLMSWLVKYKPGK